MIPEGLGVGVNQGLKIVAERRCEWGKILKPKKFPLGQNVSKGTK